MIKTFDRARWDDIFGAGTSVAEQKILDAMLWDEEGYFDPDAEELRPGPQWDQVLASMEGRAALVLARRLAYEGLTPPKAIRLDEFVAAMGSEGLGDELDVEWHSPHFFPMWSVADLVDRTALGAPGRRHCYSSASWVGSRRTCPRYLPLLQTGRRVGTEAEPVLCRLVANGNYRAEGRGEGGAAS